MNARNLLRRLAVFGLATAAVGFGATAMPVEAPPATKTIQVLSVSGVSAASPEARIWMKAPATRVALQPAFPGHVSIVGTAVTKELTAQAVRAGGRLFVKLSWSDPTANTSINDTVDFVDGAAVQFPVNGKTSTSPFMGDSENPVNIWHWRADGRTGNLVAYGFGTVTRVPFEGLTSTAQRTHGGWAVVLTRPLKVESDVGVSLQGRSNVPVAFAVWDGNDQERDGLKAVTLEWWQLRF